MRKIYLTIVTTVLLISNIQAQQDPHYTQYMYNMNVMNPAYAGSKENLSGGLLYRQQWAGVQGAPKTATFNIQSPIAKNIGLGFSAVSDKIGPVEENNTYADVSYTLNLKGEKKLAFGIKAGATFQKIGLFSEIGNGYTVQANDLAFKENTSNIYMNIGAGLFYYSKKYYMAFSVPNMLSATQLKVTENNQQYNFGKEIQHYFLTGGYVFSLTPNTKFKPSMMLKSAFKAPVSLDLSANFLFFEKLEGGLTYRLNDSFGAMVNLKVLPSLRVGYAYDHIISDLNVTTPASHEFMLLFDLNFPKKSSVSPRFF